MEAVGGQKDSIDALPHLYSASMPDQTFVLPDFGNPLIRSLLGFQRGSGSGVGSFVLEAFVEKRLLDRRQSLRRNDQGLAVASDDSVDVDGVGLLSRHQTTKTVAVDGNMTCRGTADASGLATPSDFDRFQAKERR